MSDYFNIETDIIPYFLLLIIMVFSFRYSFDLTIYQSVFLSVPFASILTGLRNIQDRLKFLIKERERERR